ncbi:UDP-N-acetylglucosamine--dolichyl-phosphate N-acetylglucosaminephosphotransferase [Nematocida homosporus]|uniref:UDP-N-acetylglucosamine--dolichyl-phosphate N-acetylglucosaminephosphotransferase n=1 Tax=Nematocida homosporus TaxID=1912981 RepID=UPI00221EA085|nr:UDP-N-acetylglucosamine--dolichyl-phosphate N-acetylglucosaminephosphotransferase [Nematocida homosporus]KAI5184984.1 UDP-N-acetylglucosamine--dolichyl-phosphate N-acetylglucosaminephosphotransferase [Nematocida homosporus]
MAGTLIRDGVLHSDQVSFSEGVLGIDWTKLGFGLVGVKVGWGVLIGLVFGVLAYRISLGLMKHTRIFGIDLNKETKMKIPEGVGLGCGLAFVCSIFCLAGLVPIFREVLLVSACTITLNLLLGYVDDTMELGWSCKLVFPLIAMVPLVLAYNGSTWVQLPFRGSVDLGGWFYGLVLVLAVFFTNAVNILSGVNGVESGQVLVISGFMVVDRWIFWDGLSVVSLSLSFSLFCCTLGLFWLNAYPARCFVGDTFCYFAGSSILCVGLVGGFTKTVFVFFGPQLLNFGLSLPQLAGIVACPRHRMPRAQRIGQAWLVRASEAPVAAPKRLKLLQVPVLRLAYLVGLVEVEDGLGQINSTLTSYWNKRSKEELFTGQSQIKSKTDQLGPSLPTSPKPIQPMKIVNFTLLNLILQWFGPMSERALAQSLMLSQGLFCTLVILGKIAITRWC